MKLPPSSQSSQLIKLVPASCNNMRLDLAISKLLPEYSRSRIQDWIKKAQITVDNKELLPKSKVHTGQSISINIVIDNLTDWAPQAISLEVIYEDQDIIVINKPPGIVTHPGAGNCDNTILNALLYRYPELAKLPRAGIVHRLDKDTSGVMVIARNLMSHNKLVAAMQLRKIKREYEAIVNGEILAGGVVDAPIGRHPTKRTHMAVRKMGKSAVTHYRVIKRFLGYTYLYINLETGRTHQIRVHLAHIGHPVVGDPNYNKINKISEKITPKLREKLQNFNRQALHAKCLTLSHPRTNESMSWQAPMPNDMKNLLNSLQKYAKK